MVAPLCSYEDQQWSSLLEDRLSQAESSEMTHHLDVVHRVEASLR